MLLLFYMGTKYGDSSLASTNKVVNGTVLSVQSEVDHLYPFYQDVHVMIFIGFGFLMTFLKKYTFSSVGLNFLIAAFAIQWSMIVNGFVHSAYEGHGDQPISLSITTLITSDFAAGAVLISFGAVLGKTSPLQMLLVVIFELIVYACNELIGATILGAVDMGGSIFVHTFGAYFGLALSRTISKPGKKDHPKNGSSYTSDTFAMVGTLFLWMYWPSFNGALATESQQHRVVINTVLALCSCCVTAFLVDALVRPENKFDMVSIQNATLAGGVAVGSSSDLVIQPWGAILIGCVAGIISVTGYVYIQPMLAKQFGLDDTCGVHNLHGLPGIVGALGGAISAALATPVMYGESVSTVFPRRGAPDNLTASQQAGVQVAALGITLLFSLCGGVITGMIIKMPCLLPPAAKKPSCFTIGESSSRVYHYEDSNYWETPEEGEEEDNEDEKIHELEMLVRDIEMANARKAEIESELGNAGKSTDVNDVDVNDKVTSEAKE
jgi:ammonium transporter Rh